MSATNLPEEKPCPLCRELCCICSTAEPDDMTLPDPDGDPNRLWYGGGYDNAYEY